MNPADPRRGRTGDHQGAMTDADPPPNCWFCRRPGATGESSLRSTKIPICPPGVGCQDGRIYHGPPHQPHWPDANCQRCIADARGATRRRRTTNQNRR